MPGSRVVDKTPVRKSTSVPKKSASSAKKGAPSKSTTSKEARKGSSTTIDITPNCLTSASASADTLDTLGDLDLYGGGGNLDDSFESHKLRSPSPSPAPQNVSVALKEITNLLNTVVKRMDRMESELKRHSTSVSSSAGESTKKSKVPLVVKVSDIK